MVDMTQINCYMNDDSIAYAFYRPIKSRRPYIDMKRRNKIDTLTKVLTMKCYKLQLNDRSPR